MKADSFMFPRDFMTMIMTRDNGAPWQYITTLLPHTKLTKTYRVLTRTSDIERQTLEQLLLYRTFQFVPFSVLGYLALMTIAIIKMLISYIELHQSYMIWSNTRGGGR
jgi:hypothetical protein